MLQPEQYNLVSVILETRGFAATQLLPQELDHDQQLRSKVDSLLKCILKNDVHWSFSVSDTAASEPIRLYKILREQQLRNKVQTDLNFQLATFKQFNSYTGWDLKRNHVLGEVRLLAPGNQPRPADMKSILVLINNEDFNWDNPGLNKTFSRENSRN